jgi:hypothetical protein
VLGAVGLMVVVDGGYVVVRSDNGDYGNLVTVRCVHSKGHRAVLLPETVVGLWAAGGNSVFRVC